MLLHVQSNSGLRQGAEVHVAAEAFQGLALQQMQSPETQVPPQMRSCATSRAIFHLQAQEPHQNLARCSQGIK